MPSMISFCTLYVFLMFSFLACSFVLALQLLETRFCLWFSFEINCFRWFLRAESYKESPCHVKGVLSHIYIVSTNRWERLGEGGLELGGF